MGKKEQGNPPDQTATAAKPQVIRINKARYWWAVLWLENLPKGWQIALADLIQLPFAYVIHDKDLDKEGDNRKPHIHLIIAFPNTTTYKHAMEVFRLIAGDKAVNTCQAIVNIRHAYNYLIHDTDSCRDAGKHQYDARERVCGNGFDIGFYEQVSQQDKQAKLREILDFTRDNMLTNMAEFWDAFSVAYPDDPLAFEVFTSYNSLIDRLCTGNYKALKKQVFTAQKEVFSAEKGAESVVLESEKTTEDQGKSCFYCGSGNVIKKGKTPAGTQRYMCKDCNARFV